MFLFLSIFLASFFLINFLFAYCILLFSFIFLRYISVLSSTSLFLSFFRFLRYFYSSSSICSSSFSSPFFHFTLLFFFSFHPFLKLFMRPFFLSHLSLFFPFFAPYLFSSSLSSLIPIFHYPDPCLLIAMFPPFFLLPFPSALLVITGVS